MKFSLVFSQLLHLEKNKNINNNSDKIANKTSITNNKHTKDKLINEEKKQNNFIDTETEVVDNLINEEKEQQLYINKIDNMLTDNKIGIAGEYAAKLQKIATKNNIVYGMRPVEPLAKSLIKEGYPTKGFNIKGKSSNWGPQAGFICKNQFFSKKNGSTDSIAKLNNEIEYGLKQGYFNTTNLKISKNRILELQNDFNIINTSTEQDNQLMIYTTSPSGNAEEFIAKYDSSDDSYAIFYAKDNTPIEVVSDLQLDKPLTADYDLLLIAPTIGNFNNNAMDSRPGKMATFMTNNHSNNHNIEYIKENVDPKFGNYNKRSITLINEINKEFARGDGLELVHHSDDAGNPCSNMEDNFPATFFLPEKIGSFDKIAIIKDKKTFNEFIVAIKDAGFHFEAHPNWKAPKRSSFEEALFIFENKA